MISTKKLNEAVNKIAPYELAQGWDNCGLIIDCGKEIDKILFALDVTNEVIAEAKELGCKAIVSHHPIIFQGVKSFADGDPVLTAAKEQISIISAHTCFDVAEGGVNDVLCKTIGIENIEVFAPFGRGGTINKQSAKSLAELVKKKLNCSSLRYVDGGKEIEKVAVIGGAASEFIGQAHWLGYDAFITGEIKHHEALFATQLKITVISAGHFETENPSIQAMADLVSAELGKDINCIVSKKCINPIKSI